MGASHPVVWLYRAVTRLYPAAHRARYGDEQVALFLEIWASERPAGLLPRMAWASSLFARALWSALGVHRDRRRSDGGATRLSVAAIRHGGRQMWNDVRFTVRTVRSARWYSATAVGVIAMTLALATTVFAVVDGVLFRPLPYPEADRLVVIEPGFEGLETTTIRPGRRVINTFSDVDLANWRSAVPESRITGFSAQPWSGMGVGVNQDAAGVAQVTADFFDVIGVRPIIGGLSPADFAEVGRLLPVLISFDVWQARFEGAPDVIGREVVIDPSQGMGYRVAGVMPQGFVFPSNVSIDFITSRVPPPGPPDPTYRRIYTALARLPDGMTAEVLAQRLAPGVAATAAQFPPQGPKPDGWSDNAWRRQGPYETVAVTGLGATLGRDSRPLFQAVFIAVMVLVALASINLSSLMSARVLERARELDIRRAVGAPGAAIVRLMLSEAGVLIAAGTVVGVIAAAPLLRFALALLPEEVVLLKPPRLDWRVGGFAAISMVALTLLTMIAPTVRAFRLGNTARVEAGSGQRTRTPGRFAVVAVQVAGALVLTVLGSLLVGSVLAVYANDRPLKTDDIALVSVMVQGPGATMDVSEERTGRARRVLDRLRQVEGVRSVAMSASQILVGGGEMSWFTRPEGANRIGMVDTQAVSPDFYRTLEPELVAGRMPTDEELAGDAPVVLVGERVASAYWPDAMPVGQTLVDERTQRVFTVVGVVKDIRWTGWDMETASIYGPYALLARAPWITFFLRTDGRTSKVMADAAQAIEDADPLMRVRRAATLEDQFRETIRLRRFQGWLFGLFGAVALAVVGVGILGLLAMSAARRTKEIGIRSALGATRTGLLRWLWLEEQLPVGIGLIAGIGVSAWAVTLVKSYLYGVTASDPRVWIAALIMIVATAGIGALIPAWRASRIDPLKALRVE